MPYRVPFSGPWRTSTASIPTASPVERSTLTFGVTTIDGLLPGGGLAIGAIHEVSERGPRPSFGGNAVLLSAGILARRDGSMLWCLHSRDLIAPALARVGLRPDRVIFCETWKDAEILPAIAGVVGDRLPLKASRRLRVTTRINRCAYRRAQLHRGDRFARLLKNHHAIFSLRTNTFYRWTIASLKQHVFPFLSAVFMVWLGATVLSHFLFNVADSAGAFCREAPVNALQPLNRRGDVSRVEHVFTADAMCFATGVKVEEGGRYSLRIEVTSPWKDADIATDPNGFRTTRVRSWGTKLVMYSGVPLRRVLFRPWFRLIARVGATGNTEYFLDPEADPHQPNIYEADFKAEREGEIFLYVNDAVVALPYLSSVFYRNNSGTAKISVVRK